MLGSIIAIIGGVLAATPAIIAKKPNAKDLLDKLTPYQGWIGVVLAFWGVWGIVQSVLNLTSFNTGWLIFLGVAAVEFIVGFILGYGLISKYLLEKNEVAKEKGQILRLKLLKYQIPAGFILAVLGVLSIVL
ncbi:hypothetical protein ACQY1Q_10205 [Tenacibaculum sp. TC6]|uniref:hypothetical protein n=1 Tax=Tenacibaculum sp. TC6 TaxID=3423223 RepID=UPI003D360AEA